MMEQTEFIGYTVVALGALTTIVVPIVRLNASIVRLHTMLSNIVKINERQDEKIVSHDNNIVNLTVASERASVAIENHETRIRNLEEREVHKHET